MKENISKYNGSEVILKMKKQGSPFVVWFIPDNEDDFLINVVRFFTKSGTISDESLIIKSDLERRIDSLQYEGFDSKEVRIEPQKGKY